MTSPIVYVVNPDWQEKALPGIIKLLKEQGETMVEEARELVPIGDRPKEGRVGNPLHDSIYAIVVQPGGAGGKFTQAQLQFGAAEAYAMDVEFGHRTTGDSGGYVEEQPFMRPVFYKKRTTPLAVRAMQRSGLI